MLAILLAALESEADKQKFTDIYEQYHPQMEQTALRILKNQHDAEDAVQNAFMQIIRHFEKIDEIPCEKLPFWIVCIVGAYVEGRPMPRSSSFLTSDASVYLAGCFVKRSLASICSAETTSPTAILGSSPDPSSDSSASSSSSRPSR